MKKTFLIFESIFAALLLCGAVAVLVKVIM